VSGKTAKVETFLKGHPKYATLVTSPQRVSAIHIAASRGRADLVKFLHVMGANLLLQNIDTDQPIHLAAVSGSVETVRYLLSQHVDPNVVSWSGSGYTPLSYATWFNRVGVAKELLKSGAKVDFIPEPNGTTALTTSAHYGSFDAFKVLLEHKANPNLMHPSQGTALVEAVQWGAVWVKMLLAAGANPNEPRSLADAFTALHQAAFVGTVEVVRMLLARGANPNTRDVLRKRPLDYAIEYRQDRAADILRKVTRE